LIDLRKDIVAVYFDFFGTLIDSRYTLTNIWSRIAKRLGREIDSDDPRIWVGIQNQWEEYEKLGKLYINLSPEEWHRLNIYVLNAIDVKIEGSQEIISEEFQREFHTGMTYRLYPRYKETLEQIRAKNIKIGLHTHAPREACQIMMKELKIFEFFDIFIHTQDFGYIKSHIEIYQIALDAIGTKDPKKICHVGDDIDLDVKMAQKIGMTPILFDPYNRYLLKDIIVISELPEILKFL